MYSYEERKRAVELYVKYEHRSADVIRELGYPKCGYTLILWHSQLLAEGNLREKYTRNGRYTVEEQHAAIQHYLGHGKNIAYTCRALGYPSRATLSKWVDEQGIERIRHCTSGTPHVQCSMEQKIEAATALAAHIGTAQEIAAQLEVSMTSVYKWKNQLLGKSRESIVKPIFEFLPEDAPLEEQKEILLKEMEKLQAEYAEAQRQLQQARLEYDVLRVTAEVLKKGQGASPVALTNREKTIVIDALRPKYELNSLLSVLQIAKSSYCYQRNVLCRPDKYHSLREKIVGIFYSVDHRYGYRRIHSCLAREGIHVSEKIVRRIMHEENLRVPFVKLKKYSSYQGEISPAVENLVKRDFHADAPNKLWLTDITEFHIPAGKVYLSPMVDCYDGMVVAWTIGTSPNADLVNTMLDRATEGLRPDEHPIVHTDRGAHYQWPGWISRMEAAQLTRSMSKKGCSPDNAACEGFHGRLKNEFFYNHSWRDVSIEEFITALDDYLVWYCNKRIKIGLGGLSPMEYRKKQGLCA